MKGMVQIFFETKSQAKHVACLASINDERSES